MTLQTIKQGDLLPALAATLKAADGSIVDLTTATEAWFTFRPAGTTSFTKRAATITNAIAGAVQYDWQAGDTADLGDYESEFEIHFGASILTFPSGGYIQYTVIPQLDGSSFATPLGIYYEPVRCLLQDTDRDIPEYADDQLDASLRLTVNSGKLKPQIGTGIEYAITNAGVVPPLTPASDRKNWVRLVYYSAKRFGVSITDEYVSLRSISSRTAQPRDMTDDLLMEIYELENGEKAS